MGETVRAGRAGRTGKPIIPAKNRRQPHGRTLAGVHRKAAARISPDRRGDRREAVDGSLDRRRLTRLRLGRLASLAPKEPARRYQRERPGELLHLDIKKLARFDGVGHRITGDRRGASTGMGYDCLHVAIDDATRIAYVEVLPDEKKQSTTGFLVRALRWFKARGVAVERVMTDNGSGYVAKLFRKALRILGIRHIRTRPYTPKTNGKAERFIQTMLREWAYAIPFKSSRTRAADLARWLSWYNERRPHSALNRRPPAQALAGTT